MNTILDVRSIPSQAAYVARSFLCGLRPFQYEEIIKFSVNKNFDPIVIFKEEIYDNNPVRDIKILAGKYLLPINFYKNLAEDFSTLKEISHPLDKEITHIQMFDELFSEV